MDERLQLGPKQRNPRETGVRPRKGKNTGESPELSKTRGRRKLVNAPAATGCEEKPQTEARSPTVRIQG